MYRRRLIIAGLILSMFVLLGASQVSYASVPVLNPPTGSLPSISYWVNQQQHYTITTTEWQSFFKDVYDNNTYVSFNWTKNTTQELIVFDLSYTGLNPYGLQIVISLSGIGFPSIQNMTLAFNKTKNMASQISGYTNIQALNSGAYPGFSWSVPITKNANITYEKYGIIAALGLSVVVLYYVFNRKK